MKPKYRVGHKQGRAILHGNDNNVATIKVKDLSFHIETSTQTASLNFFTQAKNKKEALKKLLKNSWDFENCANDKGDWVIKIKQLK